MKIKWRYGVIAGLFLAIFSLYPQMKMVYLRGTEWNGHYAYNDIDEVAYASYLKALIDGRPRKNDPYTGRDDSAETPQPESLFSIQFAGPYTIAIPARVLGIPATWAMTISGALAAFLTALAIFWLIWSITHNSLYSMAATIIVLAGGALFAGEGAILEILTPTSDHFAYPYFPGFRRYIPAMAMPAFFSLVALVWKIVGRSEEERSEGGGERSNVLHSSTPLLLTLAIAAFAYTVFSYFYIWTAAAAWLGSLGLLWVIARPDCFPRDLKRLGAIAAGSALSLVPYAYLLGQTSAELGRSQLLENSNMPDLLRPPLIYAAVCIIVLGVSAYFGRIRISDKRVLLVASFCLCVGIIFNQQVITGQSLQPIHYQVFIGNYVAGLAIVLTSWLAIIEPSTQRVGASLKHVCITAAVLAVMWGFVECHLTVRTLDEANIQRDRSIPAERLLGAITGPGSTVLSFDPVFADDLPSVTHNAVVWAPHQFTFATTNSESELRYFKLLYFMNFEPQQFRRLLIADRMTRRAIFGWGRGNQRLTLNADRITENEMTMAVSRYQSFSRNFDRRSAAVPQITAVVARIDEPVDMSRLERWYSLGPPQISGDHVIYEARLR